MLSTKFLKLKVGNPVGPTHVLSQDPMRPSASEPARAKISSPVIKDTGSLVFRWLTAKIRYMLEEMVYQLAGLSVILHLFKYQIVFFKYVQSLFSNCNLNNIKRKGSWQLLTPIKHLSALPLIISTIYVFWGEGRFKPGLLCVKQMFNH